MVDRLSFLRLNEIARERLPVIRKSSNGRDETAGASSPCGQLWHPLSGGFVVNAELRPARWKVPINAWAFAQNLISIFRIVRAA